MSPEERIKHNKIAHEYRAECGKPNAVVITQGGNENDGAETWKVQGVRAAA